MIQLIPRVQNHISLGSNTTYWQVNSGTLDDSATSGPNIARIPLPWAATVRNLALYSRDTTRTMSIAATLMKNMVATSLAGTLPSAANGPVHVPGIDVSFAALDDFSYRAVTSLSASAPGNTIGWCVEVESQGNIFGVDAAIGGGGYPANQGGQAGALGNGFWQAYDHAAGYSRSSTYSICATPGDLTTIAWKCYHLSGTPIPIPGGSSWIIYIILNGVRQDGAGATVDTRTTIPAGSVDGDSGIGTFTLPLVKGDHVEVAAYRTGATSGAGEPIFGVGLGFMPTTDGYFMLTGGSNSIVASPGLGYVWVRAEQGVTDGRALAPTGPSGLIARGMYIERGAPGLGNTIVTTLRRNEGPTSISVTLTDAETSGVIDGQFTAYVDDDLIDIKSDSPVDSRLYWGLEASMVDVGPPEPAGVIGPHIWIDFNRTQPGSP